MQTSFLETEVLFSDFAIVDYLEVSGASINVGVTSFIGPVDFYGPVSGLPTGATGPQGPAGPMGAPGASYNGPQMLGARCDRNGNLQHNVGFSSVGIITTAKFRYTFDTPMADDNYSVVASINTSNSNIHANVVDITADGFTVYTGRSSAKPFQMAHSVIVMR